MATHFAFLRAINVSGTNLIKMEELRAMLSSLKGVKNLNTYIASGNVLFDSAEKNLPKIEAAFEKKITAETGFDVPVMVRTHAEMQCIVEANPFAKEQLDKETVLYCALFKETLTQDQLKVLSELSYEAETFVGVGKEAYILVRKPLVKKDVFSNKALEKKLKAVCTSRNWNTMLAVLK
jgi:uncharacterized protein (DUF1697 family)